MLSQLLIALFKKGEIFIRKLFYSIKDFIKEYKSYIFILIILILSISSLIFENIKSKSEITINGETTTLNSEEGKIAVYISGEVQAPGVYYIDEDSRIVDLLEIAGGLTESADISDINLAEKLEDSQKVDIPTKTIEEEQVEESDEETTAQSQSSGLININTATKDELKTLNGIGDTLAQNIIDYRKNNEFESIEDILNVSGIGDSKYEKIKEYICVN